MRKRVALRILILGCAVFCLLLCNGNISVYNSKSQCTDDGCSYDITVVANCFVIMDEEYFAEKLVSMCLDNSFKDVQFSYDQNGYPVSLYMTVFANELCYKLGIDEFKINITQDVPYLYNLRDNPEQFVMEIQF